MAVLDKIFRVGEGKKVKALQGLVPDINARESDLQKLSDAELQGKTADFRQQLDNGADLTDIIVDAFAVTREAASRTIGQRHYDVQLMGGAALHYGWIAEMKTGEGKTLTSTLPMYLNGLTGQGLNVYHANDDDNLIVFHRFADGGPGDDTIVVVNLSNEAQSDLTIGLPRPGLWKLRFNSDATNYSDAFGDFDSFDVTAYEGECDGLGAHAEIDIAPYSLLIYSMDE